MNGVNRRLGALLTWYLAGLLFSVGLVISGMTQPSKVVGFLDFVGDWDPSLALVMGGGVLVHMVLYRFILRQQSPLLAGGFHVPSRRDITPRLVGGAALFGVGWGLAGYCPGPGLVGAGGFQGPALLFVGGMMGGMLLFRLFNARVPERAPEQAPTAAK